MTAVRTALLVANSTDSDAGYVGERLSQRGYALRTVLRETGEVPVDVAAAGDVDVVVCLGSEWSVHTPVDASALRAECALVRSASAAQIPVLGICYGAQVVAAAFGGAVTRAATPEIGWIEVTSLDADLVPTGPWLAFHLDVVHLPPQARLVADNDCGAQAFVLPGVLALRPLGCPHSLVEPILGKFGVVTIRDGHDALIGTRREVVNEAAVTRDLWHRRVLR